MNKFYYFIEALSVILITTLSILTYRISLMSILAIAVGFILLAIAMVDIKTKEIPNGLIIALVPFALAMIWVQPWVSLLSQFVGFFVISVPMLVMALLVSGAFGGGDIKLMAVCGFLLGWQNALFAFVVAVLIGGSYAVFLVASGKKGKKEFIPFAPALCTGVFVALLFGQMVLEFYFSLFLF